ncbi:MAG: GAF domain-containing protein [Candidatus Methanofastidiosia archaeon]
MKSKTQKVLREITSQIQALKSMDEIYERVVQILSELEHFTWTGIYLLEEDELVLKCYRGEETQHKRIKIGEGICGYAAKFKKSVVVPDVSKDSRYLSCFPQTKSEIVVPIVGKEVYGEIDVDSDILDAFGEEDRILLEEIASELSQKIERKNLKGC